MNYLKFLLILVLLVAGCDRKPAPEAETPLIDVIVYDDSPAALAKIIARHTTYEEWAVREVGDGMGYMVMFLEGITPGQEEEIQRVVDFNLEYIDESCVVLRVQGAVASGRDRTWAPSELITIQASPQPTDPPHVRIERGLVAVEINGVKPQFSQRRVSDGSNVTMLTDDTEQMCGRIGMAGGFLCVDGKPVVYAIENGAPRHGVYPRPTMRPERCDFTSAYEFEDDSALTVHLVVSGGWVDDLYEAHVDDRAWAHFERQGFDDHQMDELREAIENAAQRSPGTPRVRLACDLRSQYADIEDILAAMCETGLEATTVLEVFPAGSDPADDIPSHGVKMEMPIRYLESVSLDIASGDPQPIMVYLRAMTYEGEGVIYTVEGHAEQQASTEGLRECLADHPSWGSAPLWVHVGHSRVRWQHVVDAYYTALQLGAPEVAIVGEIEIPAPDDAVDPNVTYEVGLETPVYRSTETGEVGFPGTAP